MVLAVHLLLTQHLEQTDEAKSVREIFLQVVNALVDTFEVLIAPTGERVLLDLLPGRVIREVLLSCGHLGSFSRCVASVGNGTRAATLLMVLLPLGLRVARGAGSGTAHGLGVLYSWAGPGEGGEKTGGAREVSEQWEMERSFFYELYEPLCTARCTQEHLNRTPRTPEGT